MSKKNKECDEMKHDEIFLMKKIQFTIFVDGIPENVSNSPLTSAIQYLEKEFKPIEWMTVYKNFMKINS